MPDTKKSNVLPLPVRLDNAQQYPSPTDAEQIAFYEWMGGDAVFQITVLMKINDSSLYDCGYPTHEASEDVVLLGGYEIHAKGDGISFGNAQCMQLYFHSESREQADAAMALLAVGNFVLATGYHCLLLDDDPPSFTVYIQSLEDIRPVPAHFLPAAAWWFMPPREPEFC